MLANAFGTYLTIIAVSIKKLNAHFEKCIFIWIWEGVVMIIKYFFLGCISLSIMISIQLPEQYYEKYEIFILFVECEE